MISESQQQDLSKLLEEHGFSQHAECLFPLARNAVMFSSDGPQPEAQSRFGGVPDVPRGFVWPADMAFLLQLNLQDVPGFDHEHQLPESGTLYFFLGEDEAHANLPNRVLYHAEDGRPLARTVPPPHLVPVTEREYDGDPRVIYTQRGIRFHPTISLPEITSPLLEPLWDADVTAMNEQLQQYSAMRKKLVIPRNSFRLGVNQLLGFPSMRDEDPFENAAAAYPETIPEDWQLLLELDSDLEVGTCFWDAGKLHFLILKGDLAVRRFDRVYAGLVTG